VVKETARRFKDNYKFKLHRIDREFSAIKSLRYEGDNQFGKINGMLQERNYLGHDSL
jgi:hypothetical protein